MLKPFLEPPETGLGAAFTSKEFTAMKLIAKIFANAAVIMLLLPALGLVAFHGGFGAAIWTTIVVVLSGIIVALLLWPVLIAAIFAALFGEAVAGDGKGQVAEFILDTVFMSLCLWVTSGLVDGVQLFGFWPTVGAAAILVIVDTVVEKVLD